MKTGRCTINYKDQFTKGKCYEVLSTYKEGFFTVVCDNGKLTEIRREMFEAPVFELSTLAI